VDFDETSLKSKSLDFLRAELTRLRKDMDPLKETLYRLREKAHDYRAKRNELHGKNRTIRESTKEERDQRDAINQEIQILKRKRTEIWDQIRAQISEIRNFEGDSPQRLAEKTDFLEKREKELEWKQQTVPMTRDQEKKLIEEIAEIGEDLENLHQQQKALLDLQSQSGSIDSLKQQADGIHAEIQNKAEESQKVHSQMQERLQEIEENQSSADQHHQNLLKQMELIYREEEKLNVFHEQFGKILAEVKIREQKIREEEMHSKKEKIHELKKKRTKDAAKKMDSGKKMTFEEFYLLQQDKEKNEE
jgi:uncharacterized coiled-coil DUF342 family protein